MTRRVFFSFHYEQDVWRAGQVRNSWVTKQDREAAGYWDAVAWEEVKRKGKTAVENWIDQQLKNTSVTIVLIGSETANREYVQYEVRKSYERGNGLLGVYIHNLKDSNQRTNIQGENPFASLYLENGMRKTYLSEIYPTYDWIKDDGYNNLPRWIEAAAKQAGR